MSRNARRLRIGREFGTLAALQPAGWIPRPAAAVLPPCVPARGAGTSSTSDSVAGGHMTFQSRHRWLRLVAIPAVLLALIPAAPLTAQTRQVSIESLIYDLK